MVEYSAVGAWQCLTLVELSNCLEPSLKLVGRFDCVARPFVDLEVRDLALGPVLMCFGQLIGLEMWQLIGTVPGYSD